MNGIWDKLCLVRQVSDTITERTPDNVIKDNDRSYGIYEKPKYSEIVHVKSRFCSSETQHFAFVGMKNKPTEEEIILADKSGWMVRPCSVYDAEYNACQNPLGRWYQLYIDGEIHNCKMLHEMRKNCRLWMEYDDPAAASKIIRIEKARVAERLKSREDNDVWTKRSERPPPNWNTPLPEHITEKHKGSYLEDKIEELLRPFDEPYKGSCTIS